MNTISRQDAVNAIEAELVLNIASQATRQNITLTQDADTGLYEVAQCIDSRELALAAINALPAVDEWQPIESAPKDGRAVDLWVTIKHHDCSDWTGRFTDCYWSGVGSAEPDWLQDTTPIKYHGVTEIHSWRPLPEPPELSK